MGVQFVRVVSKEEEEQGAKILGGILAVLFGLVALYFAVVYWPVTLTILGVLLAGSVGTALTSRWRS